MKKCMQLVDQRQALCIGVPNAGSVRQWHCRDVCEVQLGSMSAWHLEPDNSRLVLLQQQNR